MKLQHIILAGMAIAMVATSCEEKRINPGDDKYDQDTIHVAPPMPDPKAAEEVLKTLDSSLVLTVAQARDTCRALASGATTAIEYYVKGWVCALDAKNAEGIENYGNATFYMGVSYLSQVKHSFEAFQVYGIDKKQIYSTDAVKVGDFVIVKSRLKNFGGVAETTDKGSAYIYYSSNSDITKHPETISVTCAEAREIVDGLKDNESTTDYYSIEGYITNNPFASLKDGKQTFWLDDTKGSAKTIEAYSYLVPNGEILPVGTKVRVWGVLTHYVKGSYIPEIQKGEVEVIEQ